MTRSLLMGLIIISGLFVNSYATTSEPVIAIIIDDIGWRQKDDLLALQLPGPVTYSILPQTPNSTRISRMAQKKGKEVMLHVPMEATHDNRLLGPGALTTKMSDKEFFDILEGDFNSVPGAVGINNHMGSLLTTDELSMHRLMNALQRPGTPFFINSKTTDTKLPQEIAKLYGISCTQRDVFLDHDNESGQIINQFKKLVQIAKEKGSALAIAHPHPETIKTLDLLLSNLDYYGVKLVPVSQLVKLRNRGGFQWREFSSHSLTAVKN